MARVVAVGLAALFLSAPRTVASADCEGCHQEIAVEWRASLHRQAFTDSSFQRAFAVEPLPFCEGCHAPEADVTEGVGCVSCHAVDAHAAPPWLSTPEACARCHEFTFPDQTALMQRTHEEHRRSSYAAEPCQSCHMLEVPSAGGGTHRSHRFGVRSDSAFLASAIRADARWIEPGVVEVSLESDRVGHSFPTGDLFRRLEIQVGAMQLSPPRSVWARPVRLGREFDKGVEIRDTRLGPPGTPEARQRHRITMPPHPEEAVVLWAVVYQRINAPLGGADVVEDQVVVAGGFLP